MNTSVSEGRYSKRRVATPSGVFHEGIGLSQEPVARLVHKALEG